MVQLELLYNCAPRQPCNAVSYYLEGFTNSFLCFSKEVYLGNSTFKLLTEKSL